MITLKEGVENMSGDETGATYDEVISVDALIMQIRL
jgi:hypothetical protein